MSAWGMVFRQGQNRPAACGPGVTGARDQQVPTVPPPVPRPEDSERIVLGPGQSLTRDYGLAVFSPPLPPGTYALHCRMVACAPRPFTVAP